MVGNAEGLRLTSPADIEHDCLKLKFVINVAAMRLNCMKYLRQHTTEDESPKDEEKSCEEEEED